MAEGVYGGVRRRRVEVYANIAHVGGVGGEPLNILVHHGSQTRWRFLNNENDDPRAVWPSHPLRPADVPWPLIILD